MNVFSRIDGAAASHSAAPARAPRTRRRASRETHAEFELLDDVSERQLAEDLAGLVRAGLIELHVDGADDLRAEARSDG